jgi:hypothetical protein
MNTVVDQLVTFIQSDVPPLRVGSYRLTATQTVPDQNPGSFSATNTFVVQGPRYALSPQEINCVFPPENDAGEYEGVLPHVVFNLRTLPWQRALKLDQKAMLADRRYAAQVGFEESPWLAVLLFNDGQAPDLVPATAQDLFPTTATIKWAGSDAKGKLPEHVLSYPESTLNPMGYGEMPTEACQVIDIPVADFNAAAPSANDMEFLGHIRKVDIADGSDAGQDEQQFAIVVGNRLPQVGKPSHAYLVSLENFAEFLPDADGKQSAAIPAGTAAVRLLCYRSWSFTANGKGRELEAMLSSLNQGKGQGGMSTLHLPVAGAAPGKAEVDAAMAAQAAGNLDKAQAAVLVRNALGMGYTACNHHLRRGGKTVSMYRGPLAPFAVANTIQLPIAGADAANSYNPQVGIFDVSYGMAWQLGQLLALQNTGFANGLYEWKRSQNQLAAIQAEHELLASMFSAAGLGESVMAPRTLAVREASSDLPPALADWLGKLALLQGVPFNYLVPDERMLPPESLRFFQLDMNWVDALIDGAFSIGRSTTAQGVADCRHIVHARQAGYRAMLSQRRNRSRARVQVAAEGSQTVTGFLLRSQVVSGWPNLRIKGFSDLKGTEEIHKLQVRQLSDQVLVGMFSGHVLRMLAIEEPPEQLHLGVEGTAGNYSTTLRAVEGPDAGRQFPGPATAGITCRADQQTLQVATARQAIEKRLTEGFAQHFPNGFTSAEFALEMTKGVVRVEFQNLS